MPGTGYGVNVSVTATTARTDLAGLDRLAPQVCDTAAAIAADAAKWSFPDLGTQRKTIAGE